MTELELKIYNALKSDSGSDVQYYYPSDAKIKKDETDAVENLANNGYIVIKVRTIGSVIAQVI